MTSELQKWIGELTERMRKLRAAQERGSAAAGLTEREMTILTLLDAKDKLTVSEISSAEPGVSDSTISTTITKLWREKKLVDKTPSMEDQRTTYVSLSEKGKGVIGEIKKQRRDRFEALFKALDVTREEEALLVKVNKRAVEYFDKHFDLNGKGQ